jgi:hypothetical protein
MDDEEAESESIVRGEAAQQKTMRVFDAVGIIIEPRKPSPLGVVR